MKYLLFFLILFYCCAVYGQAAAQGIRGRIRSADKPVAGASVVLVGSTYGTVTDSSGRFDLVAPAGIYHLRVSYVGLVTQERAVRLPVAEPVAFSLLAADNALAEVTVSTGYQSLPKERVTGSFALADRKLLERSVSTDVIDRLRDVVPGLSFNNQGTRISVRGQSTLFSNAEPLIVVDNFPYNQPIENLNPNDVESVTVLKDAAAASVWGARAGNGVIVITTKRGRMNTTPQLSFSSNVTVGAKPDLLSVPRMSSADYIGLERRLFSEGYYDGAEQSDNHLPLSPVVELLAGVRDGTISQASADAGIRDLSAVDVRRDLLRYRYRPSAKQQYALSLSGGSNVQRYYVSAGADKNIENTVGDGYDRITLNANNTWSLLGGRLEASLGTNYTRSQTLRNGLGSLTWNRGQQIYPYAQLADGSGNALPLIKDYRAGFIDNATAAGLLDWSYMPLDEQRAYDKRTVLNEVRVNTGLKNKLLTGLSAQVLYQYDRGQTNGCDLSRADSYYARNLVNHYTQDDGSGTLVRPVPVGGIMDLSDGSSVTNNLRGQLDFSRVREKHALSALAGYEVQSQRVKGNSYRLYGYDEEHATAVDVDMRTLYTFYDNPGQQGVLLSNTALSDAVDNYRSFYANAGYTYDGRLTVSASIRKDQSNLFGVRSNQKGVPLYSLGGAWELSREKFFKADWVSLLKLRAGFGYNGNVNKSLSAYTTASYFDGSDAFSQLPYARIINPPNPELRWERVQHINLGLDFGLFNGLLSGTFEYFFKKGMDLIGSSAMAPSSGVLTFTGNVADTRGRGFDLSLESRNLTGRLNWTTNLIMSRVRDVVTHYDRPSPAGSYLENGDQGRYALEGKPLFAVYSYRSAGLDGLGDPQGYLNGAVSKDYAAILSSATPDNLLFNGSSRPELFGALRNTLGYGPLELSFNISYKLGYYYRRPSVIYGTDHGLAQQSGDFALRWQQPGDEARTQVPSMPEGTNFQGDLFYRYSSALVEKADHVRLQDLRVAWTFRKGDLSFLPKGTLQVYLYAANLGILWRANHSHTDPDAINTYSLPQTIAAGVRLNLN